MQTILSLPPAFADDLRKFQDETERFRKGAISAAEYRAFRVPQGVYEQRKEGTFMIRLRLPAGGMLPHQMRCLAAVSGRYGNGVLHLTTRQDIQVHDVSLENLHPALVELHGAGLSAKGGGGNTVRNITGCAEAGVCAQEAFDVSPYIVALTEFMLADPLSYQLPRKYKIAFSGCARDCAGAMVNDLGLLAKRRDGAIGFAVYAGGGMGAQSRVGNLLESFVPADEIHFTAEAVKRVFDLHGDRKNRHRARIRFLIEHGGFDRFRTLYQEELGKLRQGGAPALNVRELPRREFSDPSSETSRAGAPRGVQGEASSRDGFAAWREHHVAGQKQAGYCLVQIPRLLGDIPAEALSKLAHVVEAHGEGMARATLWQNLVIRWVHDSELPALHRELAARGLAETVAPIVRNTVACAGASTCKLGMCLSRGLARAIVEELNRSGVNLPALGELNIHVSGCANSCSRHPLAHIGLFGIARRVGGRLAPHYVLQLGGRVGEGKTRLAEGKDTVPARNVPALIGDFLRAFQSSPQHPDYEAFLSAGGREIAQTLAAGRKYVPPFELDKNYYYDCGRRGAFLPRGTRPGRVRGRRVRLDRDGPGRQSGSLDRREVVLRHGARGPRAAGHSGAGGPKRRGRPSPVCGEFCRQGPGRSLVPKPPRERACRRRLKTGGVLRRGRERGVRLRQGSPGIVRPHGPLVPCPACAPGVRA